MPQTPSEKAALKATSLLPSTWDLPVVFRRRLGRRVGRQRSMLADGHLLLVLHAPPKSDEAERIGRFFWRSPQGEWTSNELGSGIAAINRHLDQYDERITALDRAEEEAKSSTEYFDVLSRLTPLQRAARNLHRVMQDARTACPDFADLIDLRDRAYVIERSAELLFEETRQSLELIVARRAEEQAQASHRIEASAHRLNLLAAFFFPLVTLTAILGVDMSTISALLGEDVETLSTSGRVPLLFLAMIAAGMVIGGLLTKVIGAVKRR